MWCGPFSIWPEGVPKPSVTLRPRRNKAPTPQYARLHQKYKHQKPEDAEKKPEAAEERQARDPPPRRRRGSDGTWPCSRPGCTRMIPAGSYTHCCCFCRKCPTYGHAFYCRRGSAGSTEKKEAPKPTAKKAVTKKVVLKGAAPKKEEAATKPKVPKKTESPAPRSERRCESLGCTYLVHTDEGFGNYCCYKCRKSKGVTHGRMCEKREIHRSPPVLTPKPPNMPPPSAAPSRAHKLSWT